MNVKFYNIVQLSHHLLEFSKLDRRRLLTRDFPLEEFVTFFRTNLEYFSNQASY